MQYKFLSRLVVLSVLLALMFSAIGTIPAQAVDPAPWDTNLVTNPGAEIGNLSGWSGNTGSWAISADAHQGSRSFITTFAWTTRYQEIDLLAAGFTADELDAAPTVVVGEWFKGFNCGGGCNAADYYYFKVELRNAARAPIASWSAGSQASPITATATWTEQTHTFSGYGSGLRYIYLEDGGDDAEGWAGHYGTVMDDAYAMLLTGNPIASTETASSITISGATLNGMVNANGDSTTVTFEYGLDTSYGNTVTADQSPLTDSTYTAVSAAITGLTPTTAYHFRVKAVNSTGTTYGRDQILITSHVAGIRYVKPVASGTGDCSSWENACDLQTELTTALSGDEVWVMAGTYKPTSGTDRTATFQLVNGVALYGGFFGDETQRADRHGGLSILSGDLLGNDSGFTNNGENSVHVVTGVTGATLDGFTVTGGNANLTAPYNYGGGMYNNYANPIVRNVTFSGNNATSGGGMYNSNSSPTVTNVTFSGNTAIYGGGMFNHFNSSTITNVTFSGNLATYGGGMYNNTSATVKNVIIANSIGGRDCYGTLNAASANTLIQSAANACGLTNGTNGNIIGSDPLLGALGNYGGFTPTFPLLPGSPAIDAGNAAACTTGSDQRGVSYVGTCDIGAFESQGFTLVITGGNNQSVPPNAPFPAPLIVSVTANAALEPVNGGKVTFTPPSSGASAALTGSPATVTDGAASVDATANGTTGSYTVTASTRGADDVNFSLANQETPVITWSNPADIVYGTALSGTQLNATANTPGTFTYTPASGTVLNVGTHTLHVDFVPTDTVNYTNAAKDVSITVTQATPVITWANPADIVYGTALSATQLNATANVPGAFTYTPDSGAILNVGTHTLHVDFVPTDTVNYTNAAKDVSITVTQAAPVITWANPADIVYGTALGATQLNATADVPGDFTYTPTSGEILTVGTHTLHVDFTPTDMVNYANASKDVSITVTKVMPVITWANPANIVYGTPLSGTQLNASASTPGTFTYNPASGTVLNAGTHTLHVDFVPTDTVNYANTSKEVSITVTKAAPVITWADPAEIDQGTPLSDTQLNATANTPGTFTYTPAAGTTLSAGTHTLHVDFVPTDTVNYANASKEVSINVIDQVLFADVPDGFWARLHIERLYLNQITGGCANNPLRYCPNTNVNRAMMAVFVLRAAHGQDFTPPPATGAVFADVPADGFAAAWVEQLAAEGITGGCGGGNYCPTKPVTRAQMAVFLVKAMYGTDYIPPAASGAIFADVPADGFAAAFIEQLVADGITGGCGSGNFCPNKYITRAEMAVFLVAAFDLP
ncbi:MAG: choice-of-anchor Q domain-containing protein [Chloroflexota bacterium]